MEGEGWGGVAARAINGRALASEEARGGERERTNR